MTYEVEELLGTKMRALFQRRKGRDLFDLAMALQHFPKLDLTKTIHCFHKYMEHGKTPVSQAQFEANLALKLADAAFRADVRPLLAQDAPEFDVDAAGERRYTSTAVGLTETVARVRPRVCFFGHHHNRVDWDVDGIKCVGLNVVRRPGNLVAIEVPVKGRKWQHPSGLRIR